MWLIPEHILWSYRRRLIRQNGAGKEEHLYFNETHNPGSVGFASEKLLLSLLNMFRQIKLDL